MVEIELSSKDMARLKYHFDRSLTKTDDFKYKQLYERIIEDLDLASLNYDTSLIESHMDKMNKEDEELRWKLEIIQKQVHADEVEAKEDEEEDED
jgi:hypothetical protein